jgi:UDP-4-amino-4,6-dideoxy-N-acetyl-beta-L-altrosamine transaminase
MAELKFLPYAQQNISIEDTEAVCQALTQPAITRGPLVEEFEKAVANYCGASYAVAFKSGTAALMAAYAAVDVGPSDRLLSTPNTFVSTIGAAVQRSAVPVFIDIDVSTGNIDIEQLEYNLESSSTRGKTVIAPVHFAGIPVDVKAIDGMIKDPSTVIIEDAAHAIGSLYEDGSKVGSCRHSQITIFSFHPAKTMTTTEGGMAVTNDEELCRKLRLYRNNGIERDPKHLVGGAAPWYYEVVELTGNYNFTEIQAALGLSQLRRIDSFIEKRQKLVSAYAKGLAGMEHVRLLSGLESPSVAPHLCVVLIDFARLRKDRAKVMIALKEKGIGTQVHYIPVYKFPYFTASMGDISGYFPQTETYYSQALSLPLYYDLEEADVERVVKSLKEVLR